MGRRPDATVRGRRVLNRSSPIVPRRVGCAGLRSGRGWSMRGGFASAKEPSAVLRSLDWAGLRLFPTPAPPAKHAGSPSSRVSAKGRAGVPRWLPDVLRDGRPSTGRSRGRASPGASRHPTVSRTPPRARSAARQRTQPCRRLPRIQSRKAVGSAASSSARLSPSRPCSSPHTAASPRGGSATFHRLTHESAALPLSYRPGRGDTPTPASSPTQESFGRRIRAARRLRRVCAGQRPSSPVRSLACGSTL